MCKLVIYFKKNLDKFTKIFSPHVQPSACALLSDKKGLRKVNN